jgi:hypothetical protein
LFYWALLHILPNSQIDRQKWDFCIDHSKEGVIYALSWYLDIVSPGWEALIDVDQGEYITVLPLPKAKKFGVSFLRQPLFSQQLGIFSILEEMTSAYLTQILEEVCKHYRYISAYSFNTSNPSISFAKARFFVIDRYTHFLNLNQTYEELFRKYSRDRKLNLKRAKKANIEIFEKDSINPLIDIFKEDTAKKIYGGVAEASFTMLSALFAEFRNRGLATLLYTKNEDGVADAGCLFVFYRKRITYLFNAATKEGRALNGRSLMIDKIIKDYAGNDFVLDFESPFDIEPIIYFYQGFGTVSVRYQTIWFHNLPFLVKLLKAGRVYFFKNMLPFFKQVKHLGKVDS